MTECQSLYIQVILIHQMTAQSTTHCAKHYTDGWLVTQTPSGCLLGPRWRCTYLRPKDSNATVGLPNYATTLKAPEG